MSMELLSDILIWLIRDLKYMHYHKKYFHGRGVSESVKIQPQTIDMLSLKVMTTAQWVRLYNSMPRGVGSISHSCQNPIKDRFPCYTKIGMSRLVVALTLTLILLSDGMALGSIWCDLSRTFFRKFTWSPVTGVNWHSSTPGSVQQAKRRADIQFFFPYTDIRGPNLYSKYAYFPFGPGFVYPFRVPA